jgi:hypothetical protein
MSTVLTRGLGGTAVTTAGLGDFGLEIEYFYFEEPAEYQERAYDPTNVEALQIMARYARKARIKARRRRRGGA